jgi:hypothetical protein
MYGRNGSSSSGPASVTILRKQPIKLRKLFTGCPSSICRTPYEIGEPQFSSYRLPSNDASATSDRGSNSPLRHIRTRSSSDCAAADPGNAPIRTRVEIAMHRNLRNLGRFICGPLGEVRDRVRARFMDQVIKVGRMRCHHSFAKKLSPQTGLLITASSDYATSTRHFHPIGPVMARATMSRKVFPASGVELRAAQPACGNPRPSGSRIRRRMLCW